METPFPRQRLNADSKKQVGQQRNKDNAVSKTTRGRRKQARYIGQRDVEGNKVQGNRVSKRVPEKYAGQYKLLFLKALEILNKNMLKRKKSHRRVASNWLSKFKICLLRAPKKS
ncbi:uncharacterized protein EV154DRAFT_486308 [Mucor mucedo]|uniref:uncharacterized protein n=1 Tax=Mucor mucedo TaxID=29922 RepID=UPI00221FC53E|nr:uncharacterized protein EV154DRAFT_486308 [Mucor mucedo]KAI7877554.1 hypothetical protein EV154DRAFT_486308 [Mucor mucedo]